jgi:hypothetical protein
MVDAGLRRPTLPEKLEAGLNCRRAIRVADRSIGIAMAGIVSCEQTDEDWIKMRRRRRR